jgi:hypothetical protein
LRLDLQHVEQAAMPIKEWLQGRKVNHANTQGLRLEHGG